MTKKSHIITPIEYVEVVPEQQLPGINYERRLTLARLIAVTSDNLNMPVGYAADEDLLRSRPNELQSGLYIMRDDPRYEDAELRINNVVFPSHEFPKLTRSPQDLARQMMANTRRARRGDPDRDETEHAAHRAAGHALEAQIVASRGLAAQMLERRQLMASLAKDLSGTWPHYKGQNLELKRAELDRVIHETAEVAAVNMPDMDNLAVQGLHRAIRLHLYRPDISLPHRRARWTGYMQLVARHSRAKQQVAEQKADFATREFRKYQPYLEDVLF